MEKWFGNFDNLFLSAEHGEFYKKNSNWINFSSTKNVEEKKGYIIELFGNKINNLIFENKNLSVNINFNFCQDYYNSEETKMLTKHISNKY